MGVSSLKTKKSTFDLLQAQEVLEKELQSDSDYGTAVVAVSILDEMLKELIRDVSALEPEDVADFFRSTASSFNARIETAFAFRLISERERHTLHSIRGIRNDFAHKVGAAFDEQRISDRCQNLDFFLVRRREARIDRPRGRFALASISMARALTGRWLQALSQGLMRAESPDDFGTIGALYDDALKNLTRFRAEVEAEAASSAEEGPSTRRLVLGLFEAVIKFVEAEAEKHRDECG